ncbi:DUF222 domain-containing protein [Cellulomonas sp. Marseille-Q8402]
MPADLRERAATTPPDAPGADGVVPQGEAEFTAWLAALPAGVALLSVLEHLDLERLTAFERVEVAVAAARLESRAHALKARAAASVDRHPDMRPTTRPAGARLTPGTAVLSRHLTAATLSMRLQSSTREADLLVREGQCYAGVLADTGAALADGRIDAGRARAIVRGVGEEPPAVAVAVQDRVLPGAPGRTSAQVRQDVERALVRVDGEHAADRHRDARRGRCVSRPKVLQAGMAGTWVVLPATTAVQVDAALDGAARAARGSGDGRTLDQLRADLLCDLVLGGSDAAPDVPPTQRDGAFELVDRVGSGTGSPATTPVAPDATVVVPGPRSPRTRVLVTVPLSTLIGLDDGPAELDGYGPVDAVQARALAMGGVWQRLVTDGPSGTVLDVGRTTYRPPTALAEHVRYRDRYCTAPGCAVPAARADLDHTVEFHPPPEDAPARPLGSTSDTNLGPLCRHHHRLKTSGGFTLRQRTAGEFDWRAPTGHSFRVRPGTDQPVIHLTGPVPPDDPPPF